MSLHQSVYSSLCDCILIFNVSMADDIFVSTLALPPWLYIDPLLPTGIMVGGWLPCPLTLGEAVSLALVSGALVDLMGKGVLNMSMQCGSSSCSQMTCHEKNRPCVAKDPRRNEQILGADLNPTHSLEPNPAEPRRTHRPIKKKRNTC